MANDNKHFFLFFGLKLVRLALTGGPRRPGGGMTSPTYATLRRWRFTLACEHYKKFGMTTYIVMGEHGWNAWVEVYDNKGKLYWSSFEVGLRDEYVRHLLSSPLCREEVGVDEERLKEIKEQIEKEWEEVTRDC